MRDPSEFNAFPAIIIAGLFLHENNHATIQSEQSRHFIPETL